MQALEAMWLAELVDTEVERGRVADAAAQLERRGAAGDLPFPHLAAMFLLCARGRLRAVSGDARAGLGDLEACGSGLEILGVMNPAVIPWRSRAAMALLSLGEPGRARALADEELTLARRCGVPTAIALSLRTRGLVEGGDHGIGLLREALATLEPLPSTLERAHVLVDVGAALRRAGHRADARDPLGRGLELAESFGAHPLVERARAELAATGARARKPLRTGLDALTASERRIATMAADDLSNAEIAQALFVTLRTVETHLTHAYGKLEISGRAELTGALQGPQGE